MQPQAHPQVLRTAFIGQQIILKKQVQHLQHVLQKQKAAQRRQMPAKMQPTIMTAIAHDGRSSSIRTSSAKNSWMKSGKKKLRRLRKLAETASVEIHQFENGITTDTC